MINRKAIPLIRIKYFTEPELNIRGRGKSREDVFKKHGTEGEQIFKDVNFHKYLRYFIFGPELPLSIKKEFNILFDKCNPITSGDQEIFCNLAKTQIKSYSLDSKKVAEEYFKLCIELNMNINMAVAIRNTIKRVSKAKN